MSDAVLARVGVGFFATTLVAALVALAIAPLPPIRALALLAGLGSGAGIALQLPVLGPAAHAALARIVEAARDTARMLVDRAQGTLAAIRATRSPRPAGAAA